MKLRIRGNSLRLRLTKSEVARIGAGGAVEETIEFGVEAAQRLVYALASAEDVENTTAVFDAGRITVFIPTAQACEWARTNRTSIETEKPIGDAKTLRIMIEKDFSCLESCAGEEEDADTFAHPFENARENQIVLKAFE